MLGRRVAVTTNTRRSTPEKGSIAGGLAMLLLLAIAVGVILLWLGESPRVSDVDARKAGEAVADDLGKAAEKVRDESVDAVTVTKVKTALALSKSVSAFDLDVDSEDGVVTLTGRVPSEAAKNAALRIALDVSGVKEVVDRVDVVPGGAQAAAPDDISESAPR